MYIYLLIKIKMISYAMLKRKTILKVPFSQLDPSQSFDSVLSSQLHSSPPCCGEGLLQSRDRDVTPSPHCSEQADHSFHPPHAPSTTPVKYKDLHHHSVYHKTR